MRRILYSLKVSRVFCLIMGLLSVLIVVGCKSGSSSGGNPEAQAMAQKWWERTVTKCGEELFTRQRWVPSENISPNGIIPEQAYFNFKPVVFSVTEKPLSEADKLNGVEWQGVVSVPIKAYRVYYLNASDKKWLGWNDGMPTYNAPLIGRSPIIRTEIDKTKGIWNVDDEGKIKGLANVPPKVICSELPPLPQ